MHDIAMINLLYNSETRDRFDDASWRAGADVMAMLTGKRHQIILWFGNKTSFYYAFLWLKFFNI